MLPDRVSNPGPLTYESGALTSGNKLLWITGDIARQEQFLPFSTIFQYIFLTKGVKLHVHFGNLVVRLVFSSILHI